MRILVDKGEFSPNASEESGIRAVTLSFLILASEGLGGITLPVAHLDNTMHLSEGSLANSSVTVVNGCQRRSM